ncbi:PKc-like and RNase Ire1 domain-containing protein [Phanerochaete sordida]|uniref:non-specific serine/threonine protein kinase n=1 Tax=Phanerochaete sordida TaxID=48140 RepID=A0A9P3LFD4_9APHY|nr:PKc-like and RNase Ire1 domain-containing protein [Phanerochaete sordida]
MAPLSLQAFLLLCAGFCLAEVVSLRSRASNRITDLSTRVNVVRSHEAYSRPTGVVADSELELLDIVLVASVDGTLHALNRTSGTPLWSMSTPVSGTFPPSLGPLVRTQHPEPEPGEDDTLEVYVIEPQSGDIYVMPTPDSPLQRLPFSMPQLVEMSPYSTSGDDSTKVFVGKKETSLLLLELETGRVKATVDPHSECPWDPFEDISRQSEDDDLDLDELEGSKPPRRSQPSTEIFIGRTDYHISIHTKPLSPGLPRPPVQNLSFSTYGPNNQDQVIQNLYRRTVDDTYVQSLPNGEILAFKSALDAETEVTSSARLVWAHSYGSPVVAVFDVVRTAARSQPFVLLQPRIGLQHILPDVDLVSAAEQGRFPNLERAYVGLVEETGSLYALSPDRYPLVVFGDANFEDDYAGRVGRMIDPPPSSLGFDVDRDFPAEVDSVARAVKRKKLRELCRNGSKDKRCLTGVRALESSRLSRLLDGAPTVPYPPGLTDIGGQLSPESQDNQSGALPGAGNASISPPAGSSSHFLTASEETYVGFTAQALSTYAVGFFTLVVMLAWLFPRLERKFRRAAPAPQSAHDSPVTIQPDTITAEPKVDLPATELPPANGIAVEAVIQEEVIPETPRPTTPRPKSRAISFGEAKVGEVIAGDDDEGGENGVDGDESDGEQAPTPGRRKPTRRRRGKKKKAGTLNGSSEEANGDAKAQDGEPGTPKGERPPVHVVSASSAVVPPPTPSVPVIPTLEVTDNVLGFGSHGTVVFKGSWQGRAVAVKRLLQDFVTLADREVNVLQESDDHPNVIRYYYQEAHANFLFIALELCPATLADVVERPDQFRDISNVFEPKRALRQITSGLRHLHALKIIHRDIKPQNILISHAKKGVGENAGHRMLISDFGLCKKLEIDQTSFLPTAAAGTVGWRAPEVLRREVRIDDSAGEESQSSRGSVGHSSDSSAFGGKPTRLTKSVDIFALGCLFYYVLTNGGHPYGERYEREMKILKDEKSLDGLERFGEEGSEAVDLICKMLSPEPYERPDTSTCLLHPYFWDPGKRLNFLQDASDRFEIMCRDPRDPMLIELERNAFSVVGNDWNARLDKWFIENLGKYRKYDGRSVQDLMRALRNKKHHYQDLPDNVKRQIGSMPEGFLSYFTKRFPRLFLHVHSVVVTSSQLRSESMFRTYFELNDQ